MTRIRVEKHQIKPSHPYYKLLDELCFKSKNIYNSSLYEELQVFYEKNESANKAGLNYLNYYALYDIIKSREDVFTQLPSTFAQQIVKRACLALKSFMAANKDYFKNPSKYQGKPRPPKYKDSKTGRYPLILTGQLFRFNPKNPEEVTFHKLLQGFKIKTHLDPDKHLLKEARFIPHKTHITLEIVYEIQEEIPKLPPDFKYLAGIDIGIDNFSTISILKGSTSPLIINGKGLKSYNKYFNKKLAHLKSEAKTKHNLYTTKRIQNLIKKRNNYMDNWIHQASRITANYLYKNQVEEVVIGKNKNWKQNSELSEKVNQTFIQIPYAKYIEQVIYKCQDLGIKVYVVEESYTSGTSYLDNEQPIKECYNKSRRIHRGLFKTDKDLLINSDVNAAFQILKKVYKTNYKKSYGLKLNPVRINVA